MAEGFPSQDMNSCGDIQSTEFRLRKSKGRLAVVGFLSALVYHRAVYAAGRRRKRASESQSDYDHEGIQDSTKKTKKATKSKAATPPSASASSGKGEEAKAQKKKPADDTEKYTLEGQNHKKLIAWAKKVYADQRILDVISCENMDGVTFANLTKADWIAKGVTPAPVRKLMKAREEWELKLKLEGRRKGGANDEYSQRMDEIGRIKFAAVRKWKMMDICSELNLEIQGLNELHMLRNIRSFLEKYDAKAASFPYPPEEGLIQEENEMDEETITKTTNDNQKSEVLVGMANRYIGFNPPEDAKGDARLASRRETSLEHDIVIPDEHPFLEDQKATVKPSASKKKKGLEESLIPPPDVEKS
uniref:SAM domain-containing protein n=1 Tax=Amorphochlora amoebiformis TaxID=1561963 RepID=A0A7S0D192_9EUKA